MKTEDLIPSFIDELESQKPLHQAHRKLITRIQKNIAHPSDSTVEDANYWDSEDSQEDLNDLFDALGEYCLPYFYFGAHPGDGSDYGYWLSESFTEDFEGLKINSGDSIPKGYTGEVLSVTDHGNITLYICYRGRMREIWSVV
jgi:hypothetical protein